ncbi:MAG: hypothetical protein U0835_02690 [Isosphaeraceae bacterium]
MQTSLEPCETACACPDDDRPAADAADSGHPEVRSFWLAPADSGVKSFRLAPLFSKRKPYVPESTARTDPPVRSFCLAPTSSNVRSFRLAWEQNPAASVAAGR